MNSLDHSVAWLIFRGIIFCLNGRTFIRTKQIAV